MANQIPYLFELSPCGQNWRRVPHCQGSPPSSTEFGGSLQFERSSGHVRGLDRTHRAASHCGRDAGVRLDEGESRLEQGGDTWGLGELGGDGYERGQVLRARLQERSLGASAGSCHALLLRALLDSICFLM